MKGRVMSFLANWTSPINICVRCRFSLDACNAHFVQFEEQTISLGQLIYTQASKIEVILQPEGEKTKPDLKSHIKNCNSIAL